MYEEERIAYVGSKLDWTISKLFRNELTIIMGDLKSKEGNVIKGNVVGKYGLGTLNER